MKGISYYGGKGSKLKWLLPILSVPTKSYVEPFGGSLSVLLGRPQVQYEYINDGDGQIINLWEQVQNNQEELIAEAEKLLYHPDHHARAKEIYRSGELGARAAAHLVLNLCASFSSSLNGSYTNNIGANVDKPGVVRDFYKRVPGISQRLRSVQFSKKDVIDYMEWLLSLKNLNTPLLLYADPPYLNCTADYVCVMGEDKHAQFLDTCLTFAKKPNCNVAISNYSNELYDSKLANWRRWEYDAFAAVGSGGKESRKEILWTSYS